MSHLGGYQLVDVKRRCRFGIQRRRPAPVPHVAYPIKRAGVADDAPVLPPSPRRCSALLPPRQLTTFAFALTMFVSVARVATWWQPSGQVLEPAVGRRVAGAARECAIYPPLATRPGDRELRADLRGDGCEVPIAWNGRTLRVRLDPSDDLPTVFEFIDDQRRPVRGHLLLGDWDCNGTDSPTLYVPRTGEIVSFDRLDVEDGGVRRLVGRTSILMGDAQVRPGRNGCDAVEVRPAA